MASFRIALLLKRLVSWFAPDQKDRSSKRVVQSEKHPLGINIGIDFGTSFTKVCFRDVGFETSKLVSFETRSGRVQIIPSIVCVHGGKLFMKHWREIAGSGNVKYLKMRVAGLHINDLDPSIGGINLRDERTCRALASWFLANVLKESMTFIELTERERLVNRTIIWTANVGVPVEHYDSPLIEVFREVLGVAWRWTEEKCIPSTLEELLSSYESGVTRSEGADFHAIPEISAAIQSFVMSREARPAFYVYFDIGGGTVDGVAFKYENWNGQKLVRFYSGKVEALGMDVRSETLPFYTVKSEVLDESKLNELGNFEKRVRMLVNGVIMTAKKKHGSSWYHDMARLDFFVGGYGASDAWYITTMESTYHISNLKNAGIPPYRMVKVSAPSDLDMSQSVGKEFGRFAIAYGLSIPNGEGPEITLPSKIEPKEPSYKDSSGITDYHNSKDVYE